MWALLLTRLEKLLLGRWTDLSLIVFAAMAWGATSLQMARGVATLAPWVQLLVYSLGVALFGILVLRLRRNLPPAILPWLGNLATRYVWLFIGLGVVLRVIWAIALPAPPASDGATYVALAQKLLDGGDYQLSGTYASWPPGYVFFLMPWLYALPVALAVPLSQIALYVLGVFGVHRLTAHIAGIKAAAIAAMLFALWPNLIANSSTPEKEMLILALLPWVMLWALKGKWVTSVIAGVALGAAVLVQPSLQLFIPLLPLLVSIRNKEKSISIALLIVIGALLVILPWTLRNYQVLGEFKLVSTNGGDVLYRANNPLAHGGYMSRGEVDLSHLGELEKDRTGGMLAKKWITENPTDFLMLAVEKQIRFMGDDAVGVYATFRAAGTNRNAQIYAPLKLTCNLWWLAIWLSLATLVLNGNKLNPKTRIQLWGWFYLFVLHSVFESSSKYHVPMVWILCVALAALCANEIDDPVAR